MILLHSTLLNLISLNQVAADLKKSLRNSNKEATLIEVKDLKINGTMKEIDLPMAVVNKTTTTIKDIMKRQTTTLQV